MKKHLVCALIVGACFTPHAAIHAQDPYADSVVSYVPGTGSNSNFKTPTAALGAPTASGAITSPAFSNTQIVGVGNGGELTLEFNTPITNDPVNHAFGIDFTIFGNDFFVSGSNGFSGAFTHTGLSVWVSPDNANYYQLIVPNGYDADSSFPEQGTGDPGLPVNPAFTLSSFNGLSVSQALALYNGSAGGASYSLSWAEDASGKPVSLPSISYVEIEGTSGFGYVDAVSRVENVPEPSGAGLLLIGLIALLALRWRRSRPERKYSLAASATEALKLPAVLFGNKPKQVGARNSVKIGNSRAAVTGYDFPKTSRRNSGGEGGKKASQESEYSPRFALIREPVHAGGPAKLLRQKEE